MPNLGTLGSSSKGIITGNNARFLRLWYEVNGNNIKYDADNYKDSVEADEKWYPCRKGGAFRKWFGNNEYVINWYHNGDEIINKAQSEKRNCQDYSHEYKFIPSISWTSISNASPSFRYGAHDLSESAGMSYFCEKENVLYILGLLNSKVAYELLQVLAPTLNYTAGAINNLPVKNENSNLINKITNDNVMMSARDWNSFETSWDFDGHPLVKKSKSLAESYRLYKSNTNDTFEALKSNEEEINRIFIGIYGLADELTPDVADKDVTVARIYDMKEEIPDSMKGNNYVLPREDVVKSLISYAVGCMFGRYSLDEPGLICAGGEFDTSKYETYHPDEDAIIPICDDEYFEDDIVDRFCAWLSAAFGKENFMDNLLFIADSLSGGKGLPREVIRNYFLNDFYSDHCKRYQKRPIYWLFDAGKKNSFKALVYLHRYDKDTLACMRTNYVYKQQELYKTRIETTQNRIDTAVSQTDKNKFKRELKKLHEQFDEIHVYEEKIHHYADLRQEIDLDDGVKHNYALFADILAKIK